jgi:acyl-coenzyme A thioesterase PaaI-like protein
MSSGEQTDVDRPWVRAEADRMMGKGHSAGDWLEAWKWTLLDSGPGQLGVEAHLPDHLRNPKGQLFGGFTPTYVDLISLFTVHAYQSEHQPEAPRTFLNTINMRCDYFEPILGPTFTIVGEVVNRRGKIFLVSTTFRQGDTMLAHAITTLRVAEPM